jgi:hypothetical protein
MNYRRLRPTRAVRAFILWVVLSTGVGVSTFSLRTVAAEAGAGEDLLALFSERNVFDPNRRAPRRGEERRTFAPPPRSENFRLIGALIHDDNAFGFFDGTDSDYRRVAEVGEVFAGFKVVAIDTAGVTLEKDGDPIEMAVGAGMRRVGEGAWTPADGAGEVGAPLTGDRDAEIESTGDEPAPEATTAAEDEASDVLRRMLERRRQEGSQ